MSALTPERLDEIEALIANSHGSPSIVLDAYELRELRELVRGYRAGLAAERELAAARDVVEAARAWSKDSEPEIVGALFDAVDAYDAARKG